MKRKPAIGRIIACFIASILVIAGAFFLAEANRIKQKVRLQSETRPLTLTVDFSQPGEYTARFKQTWQACHGQTLNLYLSEDAPPDLSATDLLASLDFKWQISDSSGDLVADDKTYGRSDLGDKAYGRVIPLSYFHPFDLGDYTFSCTVLSGAPALQGLEQNLVCQYQPCGLEMLPAFLGKVIGIVALVIAVIILLIVLAVTKKKGLDQTAAKATTSPE